MKNIYSFLGSNFDYLLVTDENGHIMYTKWRLSNGLISDKDLAENKTLKEILTSSSWESFETAMKQVLEGHQGIAVFIHKNENMSSNPLKVGYIEHENRNIFLFYGNKLGSLSKEKKWERNERIKELTCIYSLAEFIEVSKSSEEFFSLLPKYLSHGMLHPDEVVVYSKYDGVEYGQKPSSKNYLSVKINVRGKLRGEIIVGYHDESIALLPEEQKMLDEIKRMLSLALEKKELKIKLSQKENEDAEYRSKLEELKNEINQRTKELNNEEKKLSIVNSYLSRVDGEWEKSKTRLDTIFKAIPDEVILLDRRRKIVMTNRKDTKPGDYCYASVFGRDKPCEDCRLAKIQKNKMPVTLTMRDGERYLQVHSLPVFNKEHEVDGILEFYRDVTIEKTYEQQLQQADKLASIGELVSGIGHEINNPNQFIRGNIKIIQQSLEDIMPIVDDYYKLHPDLKIARLNYKFFREHIMVLVDDMAHGSERIKSIVKSLRAFTLKDEGLLVDTVEINTLIEETTRLVSKEVHKRSEIELLLGDNLPTFKGNIQKIEQVLINLIVNASQAIPEDRKGLIKVKTFEENSHIVIQVEDNGSGMTEKTMNQIFNPFFTTKRGKGGTGLGLAIAFRIIDEHNGNISVNSEPDDGTSFTVKIPASSLESKKGS